MLKVMLKNVPTGFPSILVVSPAGQTSMWVHKTSIRSLNGHHGSCAALLTITAEAENRLGRITVQGRTRLLLPTCFTIEHVFSHQCFKQLSQQKDSHGSFTTKNEDICILSSCLRHGAD